MKALGLPVSALETAQYDHNHSINAAALSLLTKWVNTQTNRREAYKNALAGLKRVNLFGWALELQQLVEGTVPETGPPEERKLASEPYIVRDNGNSKETKQPAPPKIYFLA